MPILGQEPDIYPDNLLDGESIGAEIERTWWAFYTLSRREKELMRRLRALEVPHYSPTVAKAARSPKGRVRTSYLPLFSNYVFVYGGHSERGLTLATNCISRCLPVTDGLELTRDLRRIRQLLESGLPVTAEEKIQAGMHVRIRSGSLAGLDGMVVRRQGEDRLVIAVNFLQQGASVALSHFDVERLD